MGRVSIPAIPKIWCDKNRSFTDYTNTKTLIKALCLNAKWSQSEHNIIDGEWTGHTHEMQPWKAKTVGGGKYLRSPKTLGRRSPASEGFKSSSLFKWWMILRARAGWSSDINGILHLASVNSPRFPSLSPVDTSPPVPTLTTSPTLF